MIDLEYDGWSLNGVPLQGTAPGRHGEGDISRVQGCCGRPAPNLTRHFLRGTPTRDDRFLIEEDSLSRRPAARVRSTAVRGPARLGTHFRLLPGEGRFLMAGRADSAFFMASRQARILTNHVGYSAPNCRVADVPTGGRTSWPTSGGRRCPSPSRPLAEADPEHRQCC